MGCLLAVAALALASCDDFLTEDPKGQLSNSNFFASQEELEMSVNALYHQVCGIQNNSQNCDIIFQGDDYGANYGSNKRTTQSIDVFNPLANNKAVVTTWKGCYNVVKAANYIVQNAERTPTTKEEVNIAIGQAKYWRAYAYFRLVRIWGPIPMPLDVSTNYERPLTSVDSVYAQIVADLTDCVNILPTSYNGGIRNISGANIFITKQAAESTLAAVYMAMAGYPLNKGKEYYQKAAQCALDVINGVDNGTYEYILEDDYSNVYDPSEHNYTNEVVVGINYSGTSGSEVDWFPKEQLFGSLGGWRGGVGEYRFWKAFPDGPRKDATYAPKIYWKGKLVDWWYKEGDDSIIERHPMFINLQAGINDGKFDYTQPYWTAGPSYRTFRHRVVRYSEVLLWYAESQARADGTPNDKAYECVNKVRKRAGLADLPQGLSGEDFAAAALAEHGWEVAGNFNAMVLRRDDELRMDILKEQFDIRKKNEPFEVVPGILTRAEDVIFDDDQEWKGDATIYWPYPEEDADINPNLKR